MTQILASLRAIMMILLLIIMVSAYMISTLFLGHTYKRGFRLRRNFCRATCWILNIHFEKTGNVINKTALYVANHRNFIDPALLCLYLDAYVVAKAEIEQMPIINKGVKITGIIYVKRESRDSRLDTRKALVNALLEGKNVLVYPEGTTNKDKYIMTYKSGTFKESVKHNIPIVPVVIEYKSEKDVWHKRSLVSQFFRQFGKWRTDAKISIGRPYEEDDVEFRRKSIMNWTNQQIQQMHKGWGSQFDNNEEPTMFEIQKP